MRRDLKGRARDWNWHNVIGIWIAVPLFVIALTGVIMAYPLANDLLYHLTGNAPPPRQNETVTRERGVEHTSGQKNRHVTETVTNLDAPFALAEMQVAGWHTTTLRLSNPGANALVFQVDCGDGGRPDLRTQVTVDSSGSRLLRVEPFSGNNLGRRLRLWTRFTHTGEAGGVAGETVAAGTSLGAALMVWTGFSLALHRFRSWQKRRRLDRPNHTAQLVK